MGFQQWEPLPSGHESHRKLHPTSSAWNWSDFSGGVDLRAHQGSNHPQPPAFALAALSKQQQAALCCCSSLC